MTARKPLVLNSGKLEQLQSGDTLDAVAIESTGEILTNGEDSDAITIGMPVYLSAASTCKKAKADAVGTTEVFGICDAASIAAGNAGLIQTSGQITSADWNAVIGSATLTAGSFYYLSGGTAGQLTDTAPTTGFVVEVGQAISTTMLQIRIRRAIKL